MKLCQQTATISDLAADCLVLRGAHGRACFYRALASMAIVFMIGACAANSGVKSELSGESSIPVSPQQTWHLSELSNDTATANATATVSRMLQTQLKMRGVDSAVASTRTDGYRVEGEVQQWHYTYGAKLRPYIEMRLAVRDLGNDRIVRSDILSDQGSRSDSLSMLADRLLNSYVAGLPLEKVAGQVPVLSASKPEDGYAKSIGALRGMPPAPMGVRRAAVSNDRAALPAAVKAKTLLQGRSVAFYYGATPAIDELSQFDRLVLEPDNIKTEQLEKLAARGAQTYAYLSVGEVGESRAYAKDLKEQWKLGTNSAWRSVVLDLANAQLRQFLTQRVGHLASLGYDGIFLDTMDSFNIVAKTEAQKREQREGLISLISEFAQTYPTLKIMTNRGFEVLDKIHQHVDSVVAESLYSGWNNEKQSYVAVKEDDRQWLLGKLDHVKTNLKLEVIVVDYVAPAERDTARRVAASIARHGFIPWVANPELDYLGVGALEVFPRKVLMLYSGELEGGLENSYVHRLAAMPLEYMGYVPEYIDVSTTPLPVGVLKGRYAGIVTWAHGAFPLPDFRQWLYRHMDDALPVAFLGTLPLSIDSRLASLMGVSTGGSMEVDTAVVSFASDMIKPERKQPVRTESFGEVLKNQRADNEVHMRYSDRLGTLADVVVTGDFGGFALAPGVVQDSIDNVTYWIVDPFRFLETALQLPRVPQPDVTTENGNRLWLAHIDGDALPSWAEMPGKLLGAEVLHNQILKRYELPHTVSIVEGEMTGIEAVADRKERMFDISKRIFKLDYVELASHTFSHPFFWSELGAYRLSGKYNLPIKGYLFNAKREVAGSIDFINKQLAPPGKKVGVMLWSGNALPRAEDLAVARQLGVANMNGGFTSVTRDRPTMSLVTAMSRPVGSELQVYAPIMNENVYTNDWRGPFDGFRKVIETFEMTDKPQRLKPINVYYHFYSGTKISALTALREVYDWSTSQEIFPVFVGDYARKVPDFRRAGVARYLDGRWKLSALGNVRSLRILGTPSYPRLSDSRGIVGARTLHDGVYFHTDGSDNVTFKSMASMGNQVHLIASNGRVRQWRTATGALEFRIAGEVPVNVELGGSLAATCVLDTADGALRGESQVNGNLRFTFSEKDTGNVKLNCPA